MTEHEWMTSTDPTPLFEFLRRTKTHRSKRGRRRLRLVGCGCAHRVDHLLTDRGRAWLGHAERLADGTPSSEERQRLDGVDFGPCDGQRTDHQADLAAWFTLGANIMVVATGAATSAAGAIEIDVWHRGGDADAARAAEAEAQAAVVRDVFANPFRPVALGPGWLTETVVALAAGIDAEGAFDRMPVLADALEDAGCDNTDVLTHCRGPGPHVRGCWVVDLALGKE